MGPKKGKDVVDENNWRTSIEDAQINDDMWKVKVILIEAAGSDDDRTYLNKFEACAAQSIRFVIKNICKTETLFMVNQLGTENKAKEDNLRVFEEGQAFLKEKKDIPADILALIIKHLILKMKNEYLFIKRQRLVVKEGISNESTTMVKKAEVRGTVKAGQEVLNQEASLVKNKTGENQDFEETDDDKKYNTLLRVRGEEWRDKVYIDDFPVDGPNLYVAITGFLEPYLASCLIKIGIPLIAIVQLRIESSTVKIPSNISRPAKRAQSQSDLLAMKCLSFWEELQLLRLKTESNALKNTAFVVYSPPFSTDEGVSDDPTKIYDELSYLIYDLQDLTRQHTHYLDNLHVICIPEETTNTNLQQNYFKIKTLPLESTTLYSILDSILQTVSNNMGLGDMNNMSVINYPNENVTEKRKSSNIETFVEEVFNNLCNTNMSKKKYRVAPNNEQEHYEDPIVIDFGDMSKYSTFHLDLCLHDIIWSSLLGMPVNKLWQYFERLSEGKEAKVNYHVNALLSCFNRKNVEFAELYRLIHILACRKLYNNRSCLKRLHLPYSTMVHFKKRLLKRSRLSEPLKSITSANKARPSNISLHETCQSPSIRSKESLDIKDEEHETSIKFLFECPDLSELVSAAEIVVKYPLNHMIEDFEYFEEFKTVATLQILHDAFGKFNCVDYKYCEATDSLILMFFNSHDSSGISREEWRGHIATPICLQDFFDFVLDEHYDWIENEENAYYQRMASGTSCISKDLKSLLNMEDCLDAKKTGSELLMEGSLKYRDHILEREVVVEEILETNTHTLKKTSSPKSNIVNPESNKKTKTSRPSTGKSLKQPLLITPTESNASIQLDVTPKKIFNGYDLCDRRVEAFGKKITYFSKNRTKVCSKYTSLLQTDIEYLSLNIVSGNGSNEFWMHKILGEEIEPDLQDICESLRITSKNKISIYLKKERLPISEALNSSKSHSSKSKESMTNPTLPVNATGEMSEICLHTLLLTWPNGLITETVYDKNSVAISHVKQFYTAPFTSFDNEYMRCVSTNGEVIIFKKDGDIEVLRPGAVYLKITKCELIKKDAPVQDHVQSEANSGTNKKKKGHDKDKASTPTKTLNSDRDGNKNKSDVTNIEYELNIAEYEMIHANGLRQKWEHDNHFEIEKLLAKTAYDYCLGQIFTKRNDGTNILLNKEGNMVITYPDKTRIITSFIIDNDEVYPEWTVEEIEYFSFNEFLEFETASARTKNMLSGNNVDMLNEMANKKRNDGYISVHIIYTVEHPYFATITINKANQKVSLDSPDNVCVILNKDNEYDFQLDDITSGSFNGEILSIRYEGCTKCMHNKKCTCITVNIKPNETWLHMKDSNGKNVIVDEEGEIHVTQSGHGLQTESETPQYECACTNESNSMKFFILNRDLTCAELLHRAHVDDYIEKCRGLQWCTVNEYQAFGDYRSLLSILTPIHRTEAEKWTMESKFANKPKYLVYKDLKHDNGKGFYHWMRPYKIYEQNPITVENFVPDGLPRAYIIRTLERQWDSTNRDKLKGAKELIYAILKYRDAIESNCNNILQVPIRDFRSESKRILDDKIQEIAEKLYKDLKRRINADIESRAHPTITTKPLPKGDIKDKRIDKEIHADEVKLLEAAAPPSPALQQYWRRRKEEYSREQFNKQLLREASIPPYFRNALGGALWWDINKAAGDAVEKVEHTYCTCHCPNE